jgi:hypothetical protein
LTLSLIVGRKNGSRMVALAIPYKRTVGVMTPEDLAERHPRLYHVTTPGAVRGMASRGLLPTSALLDLFEIVGERRAAIVDRPRKTEVVIEHPVLGKAIINDNSPLTIKALELCLDDGLCASDWLEMLNERVFFWADRDGVTRLLGARRNRDRTREVLVFDTLSLAREFGDLMELSPINSGATIRRAARRGLSTFAPIHAHSYPAWQALRGRRDRVLEVTVREGVPNINEHLIDVVTVQGGAPDWVP